MWRRIVLLGAAAVIATAGYVLRFRPDWGEPYVQAAAPYLPASLLDKSAAGASASKGKKLSAPPAPVRMAAAASKSVPIRLDGIGTVQARSTVAIKSRIDGQLFEATVKEGQLVKKGDLLFNLDPRPFEAQLKQAEANLTRDKANLEKARSDVERYSKLSGKGISPVTKLEEAQTLVSTLTATIAASTAAVDFARLNLGYATIRAPIDGRVGNLLVTPGNMVKANDTQPLLIITELDPIYVAFGVPEQHISEIRTRMAEAPLAVEVAPQGDPGPPMKGELFFINNAVDTTTGTIQLLARFANKEERLVPGQFVRATVTLNLLDNATVVPSRAVQINQRGHYVYVVKPDMTAEMRPVDIGPEAANETVITKGLAPGEKIVTDGQLRLFPGSKVAPAGAGGGKAGKGGKGGKGGMPAKDGDSSGNGGAQASDGKKAKKGPQS
jgi:multidrug efflux system membrane fusion protein